MHMHKRSNFPLNESKMIAEKTTNFDISPSEKVEAYLHEMTSYMGFPFNILLKLRVYLFSSWCLRQDLWSLRLTHWLCSSGLTGGWCLWKWILYCLLRRGCLLYSMLLRIKYSYSILFQIINSMFLRKDVCLRPSVPVNDDNFVIKTCTNPNSSTPLYISLFLLLFFICDGTTKNNEPMFQNLSHHWFFTQHYPLTPIGDHL